MTISLQDFITSQEAISAVAHRSGYHLLDVRSPGEYMTGLIPGAVNGPILSNSERDLVGRTYKQQGPKEARLVGHWLIQGMVKQRLVRHWQRLIKIHNITALFCARGGLRSEIAQQWLQEVGVRIPRVQGGYKALRQSLLEGIQQCDSLLPSPVVITGHTGCGKTKFLQEIPHDSSCCSVIDLEQLARHKGSAFGAIFGQQPSQASFENSLACDFMKAQKMGVPVLFEDESRTIGHMRLPEELFSTLQQSPHITLVRPMKERVDILLDEYVVVQTCLFAQRCCIYEDKAEAAISFLKRTLLGHLTKISKRLGGVRYQQLSSLIQNACTAQRKDHSVEHHREWIEKLLLWYYDPLYERHLQRIEPLVYCSIHPNELLERLPEVLYQISTPGTLVA